MSNSERMLASDEAREEEEEMAFRLSPLIFEKMTISS